MLEAKLTLSWARGFSSLKVLIIGAGFGGLAQALLSAKEGDEVLVLEKNEMSGGRSSVHSEGGYTFDMGPSWYLMPDVYERFFQEFGKDPKELFKLQRLDHDGKVVDISADMESNYRLFDELEEKGAEKLKEYLEQSKEKYDTAILQLLYRDYSKLSDLLDLKLIKQGRKMHMFENLDSFVNKHFQSDKAKKIVEYSIGFLGGSPTNTPSFYHIMSHIDFTLGVWYPEGGMRAVVQAMYEMATSMGVRFHFNEPVTGIRTEGRSVSKVVTDRGEYSADVVVVNADYAHSELELLGEKDRTYKLRYWEKKVLAPSAIVMYLGVDRKVPELAHHSLFLDQDWGANFDQIFDKEKATWPSSPSYYVNVPSMTDPSAAPSGKETLFVLVPLAPGLEDSPEIRERFYQQIMEHLELTLGTEIRSHVEVKRLFALNDFKERYNAYKGTALGLTHTLRQTALFRPVHRSKKVRNLYYTGHYCHPGIGVPMVLISSQIVNGLLKECKCEGVTDG
jgi:phytoene desaturase